MPVTIEDVAQRAGVSTATVSRALRGLPHVSAETRARVAGIAVDLGYVASRSASNLATGRTRTVGVVTPHIGKWFFSTALEALERELSSCGYDVMLTVLPPTSGPDRRPGTGVGRPPFDPEQLRQRVDAVAVLTVPLTGTELDALRRLQLPVVFIGGSVSGVMSVRIDDLAVGRLATQHLLDLGHRRVAHLGGDPLEPLNFHAPVDRRAGWSSARRAARIQPAAPDDPPGYFTVEGGWTGMRRLLALDDPPTAVFAGSDEMAFGALGALREAGRSAPDDVSVVGVDDHELAAAAGLTTIRQPVIGQGRTAAGLLLQALAPQTGAAHVSEHVLLPVELVERCSTGPVRDWSFVSQS
jgi:DNA-binding LacI/PurR family transcriptional regulator